MSVLREYSDGLRNRWKGTLHGTTESFEWASIFRDSSANAAEAGQANLNELCLAIFSCRPPNPPLSIGLPDWHCFGGAVRRFRANSAVGAATSPQNTTADRNARSSTRAPKDRRAGEHSQRAGHRSRQAWGNYLESFERRFFIGRRRPAANHKLFCPRERLGLASRTPRGH